MYDLFKGVESNDFTQLVSAFRYFQKHYVNISKLRQLRTDVDGFKIMNHLGKLYKFNKFLRGQTVYSKIKEYIMNMFCAVNDKKSIDDIRRSIHNLFEIMCAYELKAPF